MNRSQYLYHYQGFIHKKKKRKNPQYTQYFYQLNVHCEKNPEIKKIFAFKGKLNPKIWTSIEQNKFLGKQYLFSCRNYQGSYYLTEWEELKE